MYIPIEIQKHILSYLGYSYIQEHKKGRCICYTQKNKRCKNIVNYTKCLYCNIHNKDMPMIFIYLKNYNKE